MAKEQNEVSQQDLEKKPGFITTLLKKGKEWKEKKRQKKTDKKKQSKDITRIIGILIAFSILCFITSCFMNMNTDSVIEKSISVTGGEIGPVEVSKDYSVYNVHVKKYIRNNSWSFVGGDVLDQDKNYLFGFGKELWRESGFDSDGPWTEQDTDLNIKITFNKAGIYFLRFNAESEGTRISSFDSVSDSLSDLQVTVSPKRGSSLIHFILGCIAFIIGIGLFLFYHLKTKENLYSSNGRGWRDDFYDF